MSTARRIAAGMVRPGSSVSSPSAAAPSKPAQERNAKTVASPNFDSEWGPSRKTSQVKSWPFGAPSVNSFQKMTTIRTTIRVTETTSSASSVRVATRTSP